MIRRLVLVIFLFATANGWAQQDCTQVEVISDCIYSALKDIEGDQTNDWTPVNARRGFETLLQSCRSGLIDGCVWPAYRKHLFETLPAEFVDEIKSTSISVLKENCSVDSPYFCGPLVTVLTNYEDPQPIENFANIGSAGLEPMCDNGDLTACIYLASLYHRASWSKYDPSRAQVLKEKSCDLGSASLCAEIAFEFECMGGRTLKEGCEPNYAEAAVFYQKSCDLSGSDFNCKRARKARGKAMGLADTFNWLGDKLYAGGLVNHFEVQDCALAIDNFDGMILTKHNGTRRYLDDQGFFEDENGDKWSYYYPQFQSSHNLSPETSRGLGARKSDQNASGYEFVSGVDDAWVIDLADVRLLSAPGELSDKAKYMVHKGIQEKEKYVDDAKNKLPQWGYVKIALNEGARFASGKEIKSDGGNLINRVVAIESADLNLGGVQFAYKMGEKKYPVRQARSADSVYIYMMLSEKDLESVENAFNHAVDLCVRAKENSANNDAF